MVKTKNSFRTRVLTIGHSNHEASWFVSLLALHNVEVLVDIRSKPVSRHFPHFDLPEIRKLMKSVGVRFVYLGRELGGRPSDTRMYDAEGHVLYWRLAESDSFTKGIHRVEAGSRRYTIALMCSEEDPLGCHRRLLVGRVLKERGIHADHIRGDGTIELEETVVRRETDLKQMPLFGREEHSEWKSLQSVLQRSRQASSSGR